MAMKGYSQNIEKLSLENDNFRKVLYTVGLTHFALSVIPA